MAITGKYRWPLRRLDAVWWLGGQQSRAKHRTQLQGSTAFRHQIGKTVSNFDWFWNGWTRALVRAG